VNTPDCSMLSWLPLRVSTRVLRDARDELAQALVVGQRLPHHPLLGGELCAGAHRVHFAVAAHFDLRHGAALGGGSEADRPGEAAEQRGPQQPPAAAGRRPSGGQRRKTGREALSEHDDRRGLFRWSLGNGRRSRRLGQSLPQHAGRRRACFRATKPCGVSISASDWPSQSPIAALLYSPSPLPRPGHRP
jgi:hypothetical protein